MRIDQLDILKNMPTFEERIKKFRRRSEKTYTFKKTTKTLEWQQMVVADQIKKDGQSEIFEKTTKNPHVYNKTKELLDLWLEALRTRQTLYITVQGGIGTGKSAVAYAIAYYFDKRGFEMNRFCTTMEELLSVWKLIPRGGWGVKDEDPYETGEGSQTARKHVLNTLREGRQSQKCVVIVDTDPKIDAEMVFKLVPWDNTFATVDWGDFGPTWDSLLLEKEIERFLIPGCIRCLYYSSFTPPDERRKTKMRLKGIVKIPTCTNVEIIEAYLKFKRITQRRVENQQTGRKTYLKELTFLWNYCRTEIGETILEWRKNKDGEKQFIGEGNEKKPAIDIHKAKIENLIGMKFPNRIKTERDTIATRFQLIIQSRLYRFQSIPGVDDNAPHFETTDIQDELKQIIGETDESSKK